MKYETKSAVPSHIKAANMKQLLEMWELTECMKYSLELATVRGWLMDELEARDPEGFDRWMCSEDLNADPKDFIKY